MTHEYVLALADPQANLETVGGKGAPLSHAAIVARELGIPAVVGCGSATTRLRSGDWVRVDGGQGVVEILHGPHRPGHPAPGEVV